MSNYSEDVAPGKPGFSAADLRRELPAKLGEPLPVGPALNAYLCCYGFDGVVSQGDYQAARLQLADVELVVQRFCQREAARGTALVVHGYMDHAGLTRPLVEWLFQRGWNVVIYDLPGHGLSAGEPHDMDDFFRYTDQLAALVKALRAEQSHPLTLIGHSTGGAIITTLLLRETAFTKADLNPPVLLAPLVRPKHWRSIRFKYLWLRRWLKRVKRIYQSNSHDAEFPAFVRQRDPLQHPWISVRWIGAMLAWIDWVEQQRPSAWRPLVIQGTEDETVEWQHNLAVLERLFPQGQQLYVDAGRHNLINEAPHWQETVFLGLSQFLESETKTPGT